MVHRSTDWIGEHVPGSDALGRPYSEELTIGRLYRQRGDAVLASGETMREKRSEIDPKTWYEYRQHGRSDADTLLQRFGEDRSSNRRFYRLDDEDAFIVRFEEDTRVPEGHVGYVAPKESLLSIGVHMHGSFVGADEPMTGGMLYLEDKVALVGEDAAIAELVVWEPDH
ncbi:hypothetical protein BRD00_04630 [Halobacteriales archaeon QS_8_69_26]|nr:MAG: hypothetical protein BRD00_04630 [Halobacteriales archaeon QS_8_69_26]